MLRIKPLSFLQGESVRLVPLYKHQSLQSQGSVGSRPASAPVMAKPEPYASSKSIIDCDMCNNICFIILSTNIVPINIKYCGN